MAQDDPRTSPPPAVSSPDENAVRGNVEVVDPGLSAHSLAVFENLVPLLADPETLVRGLRYLQRRIPEFVQLSLQEQQSMTRTAHLDPAFIDAGIHAGRAWDETKILFGWTVEELRTEVDTARQWDEVIREFRALMSGIEGGNLRRKHRIGIAVLDLYTTLGRLVKRRKGPRAHLRPYLEEMQRAYRRRLRKKPRKASPPEEPEGKKV